MPVEHFRQLGAPAGQGLYRTEPALRSGAEVPRASTLIVGQRSPNAEPPAAILLGRVIEQTASKNMYNWSVWLDVTFPHVMLIAGKRGSGKSYDLGIIAEGVCAPDGPIAFGTAAMSMILFDTQNQFWTLTRPLGKDDTAALARWNLQPVALHLPSVFRPRGTPKLGEFESEFALRPSDLESDDWTALCGLERFSPMGQCLRAARQAMAPEFEVADMIEWLKGGPAIERFVQATLDGVSWRLESLRDTDLFDSSADDITLRLAAPGSKSVIQLADLDDDTKSVIVGVIMRKLIRWAGPAQRKKKLAGLSPGAENDTEPNVAPRTWVLIDEAHLVCPSGRNTAARPVIVDYVKRGRDAGLSLVLATQQPSALDTSAISQCDIVAIHKLTIDSDIDAATARMPARGPSKASKLPNPADIAKMDELTRSLDAGQSLLADSESNRAFVLQSRPRVTPHGGGEPDL
jgi:hypothetical protein